MSDVRIPETVDKAWCDASLDYDAIEQFRKTSLTKAIRMAGPFTVETSEGPLRCADGWLCFDARGYPYPVAADEFALIYEKAPPEGLAFEQLVAPADGEVVVFRLAESIGQDTVHDVLRLLQRTFEHAIVLNGPDDVLTVADKDETVGELLARLKR